MRDFCQIRASMRQLAGLARTSFDENQTSPKMAVAVRSGALSLVSQIERLRVACSRVGIFAARSATEAPKHGMNQERMKGSQAKPLAVRVTITASGTRSDGRQGKIMRPPWHNAFSHPTGGTTTPALT